MKLRNDKEVDTAAHRRPTQNPKDLRISKIGKRWPNRAAGKKSQGLYNPQAYCYRRVMMQTLLHIPVLLNWLDRHATNPQTKSGSCKCIDRKGCLACELKSLSVTYWSTAPLSGQPDGKLDDKRVDAFDDTVRRIGAKSVSPLLRWRGIKKHKQRDAPEFLQWMLDRLVVEKTMPQRTYNDFFGHRLQISWQCKKCTYRGGGSPQYLPMLAVDIARPHKGLHLNRYIARYFEGDDLQGVKCGQKGCSSLGRPQNVKQSITLFNGPEILFVQLGRFGFDENGQESKITNNVPYDLTLDLTQYHHMKDTLKYRLASVVFHCGGLTSGHYVGVYSSPTHVMYVNDSVARRAGPSSSALLHPPEKGFQAYLLVYFRE